MKELISIFMLLLTFSAYGSNGTRGGGNAIACMNSTPSKPVELLDYFIAENTTLLKLDLGPDQGTYLDRIDFVLNRLEKIDPIAANTFRIRAHRFEAETSFVTPEELKTLTDSDEPINVPKGCQKEQFAIQNFDMKPFQARYLVNQALWERADSATKAGLVLHEVIYTDAHNKFGQTTSDNVQYYNGVISSSIITTMNWNDYLQVLKAAQFFSGWFGQNQKSCDHDMAHFVPPSEFPKLFPANVEWYPCENTLYQGRLHLNISPFENFDMIHREFFWSGYIDDDTGKDETSFTLVLAAEESIKFIQDDIHLLVNGDGFLSGIEFSPNGYITNAYIDGDQTVSIGGNSFNLKNGNAIRMDDLGNPWIITLYGQKEVIEAGQNIIVGSAKGRSELRFYPSGAIRSALLSKDTSLWVGKKIYNFLMGDISFHETGSVKLAKLTNATTLTLASGQQYTFNKGSAVAFYGNGLINFGYLSHRIPLIIQGQSLILSNERNISFYKDGLLKYGFVLPNDSVQIKMADGSVQKISTQTSMVLDKLTQQKSDVHPEYYLLRFDESGAVKSIDPEYGEVLDYQTKLESLREN